MSVLDQDENGERKAWLRRAEEVIRDACVNLPEVTTHDLWPHLDFPTCGDGRLLGKASKKALANNWMTKDKDEATGIWRAYDHTDLPKLYSADGVWIRQKALIGIYRSLVYPR